jgi:hypothetical protein
MLLLNTFKMLKRSEQKMYVFIKLCIENNFGRQQQSWGHRIELFFWVYRRLSSVPLKFLRNYVYRALSWPVFFHIMYLHNVHTSNELGSNLGLIYASRLFFKRKIANAKNVEIFMFEWMKNYDCNLTQRSDHVNKLSDVCICRAMTS